MSRYFRGRAPSSTQFHSDDSDDDENNRRRHDPSTTKPSALARPTTTTHTRRRPRISARVLSGPTEQTEKSTTTTKGTPAQRGTTSGFVRVTSLPNTSSKLARDELSNSDSNSNSDSDSDSESSEGEEDNEEDVDGIQPKSKQEDVDKSDDDDDDDDDDSNDDIPRPVFIRQDLRALQDEEMKNETEIEQREEQRAKLRHAEAKRLMTSALIEEENRRNEHLHNNRDADLPDDGEDGNYDDLKTDVETRRILEADHALWKVRELLRIKRDREEQTAWEQRTEKKPQQQSEGDDDNNNDDNDKKEKEDKNNPSFMERFYKVSPFLMDRKQDGKFKQEKSNREYNQSTNGNAENRTSLSKS